MCSASELSTASRAEQDVSVSEKCVHVFKEMSFYSHSKFIIIIIENRYLFD
jgi:hypothetical protein